MRQAAAAALATVAASPALAHPGHVGVLDGHAHLIALVAALAAVLTALAWAGVWLARRARRQRV